MEDRGFQFADGVYEVWSVFDGRLADFDGLKIRSVQSDWETPYMQHWSFDVQRQLTSNTVVSAGYYGSKGTNLIGGYELNLLRPGQALNSLCAVGSSTTTMMDSSGSSAGTMPVKAAT